MKKSLFCLLALLISYSFCFAETAFNPYGITFGMTKAQVMAAETGVLHKEPDLATASILVYDFNGPFLGFTGVKTLYNFTGAWESANDGVAADKLCHVFYELKNYAYADLAGCHKDFDRLFADLKRRYGEPLWGVRLVDDTLAAYEDGVWVKSQRAVELADLAVLGWVDSPIIYEPPEQLVVWQDLDKSGLVILCGIHYDEFTTLRLEFMVKRDGALWQGWQAEFKE